MVPRSDINVVVIEEDPGFCPLATRLPFLRNLLGEIRKWFELLVYRLFESPI